MQQSSARVFKEFRKTQIEDSRLEILHLNLGKILNFRFQMLLLKEKALDKFTN